MKIRKLYVSLFIIFCSFLFCHSGKAQEFMHVDWSELLNEDNAPMVVQTVDLGKNWQDKSYSIKIEYPELAPLTDQEKIKVKKFVKALSDTISWHWQVGVSRKRGIGELCVLPLVKKDGKWMKLLSFKLNLDSAEKTSNFKVQSLNSNEASQYTLQSTTEASRYASHSVLQSGRWVKIKVSDEGIYSLTPALIKQMGFSDINKIKVYGYGGRVENAVISYTNTDGDTDDLEEVPTYHQNNNLLFYANGTLRWSSWTYSSFARRYLSERVINPYSSYSYYFVTEGDNPQSLQTDTTKVSTTATAVNYYPEHVLMENDVYSWFTSGCNLFDSYNFANGNSKDYTVLTPDKADNGVNARVRVVMTAYSTSSTNVKISMNNTTLGSFSIYSSGQYDYALSGTGEYNVNINDGENTLNIQTTSGNDARLDYIWLDYDRQLKLTGKYLVFSHYLTGKQHFTLTGADASTQIWRISKAGSPAVIIPSTLSGTSLDFYVVDASNRFVAVNTAASFPTPQVVGQITNQDLHADSAADLVMIVPASGKLTAQAERLAEFHAKTDGLRTRVVRADQLYNEFSSGTPDAGAYRRYMKMLYDRAETDSDLPKYLLLFGSSVWDNRMLTTQTKGLSPDDYLLCYESDNSINSVYSYVTDDFFGLLDDGEGSNISYAKIDLGIGRFPVTTAAAAKIIVDKTMAYIQNGTVGNWKNAVYMMADDGDSNDHMNEEEVVTKQTENLHPELLVKRIYLDAYTRVTTSTGNTYPEVTAAIKNVMNKGALIMNYSGHGAPYQVSHTGILKLSDFEEFNCARIPMWIFASCELTPYDMLDNNIGTASLLNENGATIAFFSSARAVYSDLNKAMNENFMQYVLGYDSNDKRYTIGDAARLAKVALVSSGSSSTDYTINKLKYALMGDPALTLKMATENVVLDEINGQAVSSSSLSQLKAGSVAKIKGHIESRKSERLSGFNGALTVILQDSKDTITCKNNAGDDVKPFVYYEHTKTLYEGSDSVRSGVFEMPIPIPLDIKYSNLSGRLNFYAVNKDHSIEANGNNEDFLLGGSVTVSDSDSIGPKMFVYLNDSTFKDGGTVNDTPYFYARLSDEDGINTSGNGVGHDLELIIDGKEDLTYVLNSYYENDFGSYTSGKLGYMIPTLEAGSHKLFFRAWDLKNHSSSVVLNFNVVTGLQPSLLKVRLSNNPASTSTAFIISYDRPESETQFTIRVYDCFGREWWQHTETGTSSGSYSIPWNLTSNSGVALPTGFYFFKVGISSGGSKETTKTMKFVVHRQ